MIWYKKIDVYISDFEAHSRKLDEESSFSIQGILDFSVVKLSNKIGDDDKLSLDVKIKSSLKHALRFDQIVLNLRINEEDGAKCKKESCILSPGENNFRLIFDVWYLIFNLQEFSNPGYYKPHTLEFRIGKLIAVYDFSEATTPPDSIYIHENISNLYLELDYPKISNSRFLNSSVLQ